MEDVSGQELLSCIGFGPNDGQQLLAMADSGLMRRFMNLGHGAGYFKGSCRIIHLRQFM